MKKQSSERVYDWQSIAQVDLWQPAVAKNSNYKVTFKNQVARSLKVDCKCSVPLMLCLLIVIVITIIIINMLLFTTALKSGWRCWDCGVHACVVLCMCAHPLRQETTSVFRQRSSQHTNGLASAECQAKRPQVSGSAGCRVKSGIARRANEKESNVSLSVCHAASDFYSVKWLAKDELVKTLRTSENTCGGVRRMWASQIAWSSGRDRLTDWLNEWQTDRQWRGTAIISTMYITACQVPAAPCHRLRLADLRQRSAATRLDRPRWDHTPCFIDCCKPIVVSSNNIRLLSLVTTDMAPMWAGERSASTGCGGREQTAT